MRFWSKAQRSLIRRYSCSFAHLRVRNATIAALPSKNSPRLRQRLSSVYSSAPPSAPPLLSEHDRRALHVERPGDDVQQIVHPRRLQKFQLHRAHHEGKPRRLALGLGEQRALVGTEQPQIIAAPALHEAQIIGVIDD